ncbi:MAG: hypothetical protein LBU60_00800 [Clostridiales bacterium]|jgi:hypothetical protein|nr:hypothetical protein [Clostridiales bacterium]
MENEEKICNGEQKKRKIYFEKMDFLYYSFMVVLLGFIVYFRIQNGFDDILWILDIVAVVMCIGNIYFAKGKNLAYILLYTGWIINFFGHIFQHNWNSVLYYSVFTLPITTFRVVKIIRQFIANRNQSGAVKESEKDKEKNMQFKRLNLKTALIFTVVAGCSFGLLCLFGWWTNANAIVITALSSTLAGVALIMCAKMDLIEGYFLYIVADFWGWMTTLALTYGIFGSTANFNNFSVMLNNAFVVVLDIIGTITWIMIYKKQKAKKLAESSPSSQSL